MAGDGGLAQYLSEITILVRYQMPVKLIILNNSELGKISKEQRAGEWDVWKTALTHPSYGEFARSCGAWGKTVSKDSEVELAMEELFKQPGPAVLELIADSALI